MKKDFKKVLTAQDKMRRRMWQEEALKWKRDNYTEEGKILPNAHCNFKYIDDCVAKFVIEHAGAWDNIDLLKEYLS
jgi:hypothetical protein